MAEDKKGFLLYADLIHTIEKMPSEKAGDLFKHILRYVNDLNPVSNDLIIDLTFEPIKQQLKRDLIKFEKSKDEKSLSGRIGNLKRWNIDLYNKFISKELTIEEAEIIANSRKVSQPDKVQSQTVANIAVNDNVNVNVNDIKYNISTESIDFGLLLNRINETFSRKYKVINNNVKSKFKARLKEGYTKEDIKNCIDNLKNIQYHKDNGYQYCTPEFISRSETLEKYSVKTAQTKISGEDEYMMNVMKQVNANKLL